MLPYKEPIELLHLAVIMEQLGEMRLLSTLFNVVVVTHEVLREKDAWVEALSNLLVNVRWVSRCGYFHRSSVILLSGTTPPDFQ